MRIALYQPEIPQNTGTILRLAACMGLGVDIIEPCGFIWSHPQFKRAVMDYLPHVHVQRFCDTEEFFDERKDNRVIACIVSGKTSVYDFTFRDTDTLLFGRESEGIPSVITDALETISIPMPGKLRSLNLATVVSFVAGVALRP